MAMVWLARLMASVMKKLSMGLRSGCGASGLEAAPVP